jgi:soluble lytic murein transglycosylase-like protein
MKFWYRAEASDAALRHHLDVDLVVAVCLQESAGRTGAYRYEPKFWLTYCANNPLYRDGIPERIAASYGLMQAMYVTAREMGYSKTDPPEWLTIPDIGLNWGCAILHERMMWAKGDVEAALAAYNGGKTADNKPGVFPKRTQAYVDGVHRWLVQVRNGSVTF